MIRLKNYLIFLIFYLYSCSVFSQSLKISIFADRTAMNLEQGLSTAYLFKSGIYIGYYYQAKIDYVEGIFNINNDLHGIIVGYTIVNNNFFDIISSLKPTIIKHHFIKVIPSIGIYGKMPGPLRLGVESNIRYGRPTLSLILLIQSGLNR